MSEFEVGQRVAVYNSFESIGWKRLTGVLIQINRHTGYCEVDTDDGVRSRGFHLKQCRRLKPKPKPREFTGHWKSVEVAPEVYQIAFFPASPYVSLLDVKNTEMTVREVKP